MSATALYVGVNGKAQKVFDSSDFGNLFDSAIDENNVLYSSPSITNFRDTPASYTATEDCYVYMSYWGSVGTNMYPKLNGKLIGPGALQGNKAMVLLPIKKGDIISHRHDTTMNESCYVKFEVYGRKPAATSQHNYSTTEQIIGKWIDGKTLYEKTWVFKNNALSTGTNQLSLGITSFDVICQSSVHVTNSAKTNIRKANIFESNSTDSLWYTITYSTGILYLYTQTAWSSPDIYVTLQYTKSS